MLSRSFAALRMTFWGPRQSPIDLGAPIRRATGRAPVAIAGLLLALVVGQTPSFANEVGPMAIPPSPTPTTLPTKATVANFVYLPDPIVVPVGTTIRWKNKDYEDHTVTADDRSWTSPVFGYGQKYLRTFTQPGTYTYFCEPHPQMRGEIIVR